MLHMKKEINKFIEELDKYHCFILGICFGLIMSLGIIIFTHLFPLGGG